MDLREVLENAISLRDDYIEEIPLEEVHGNTRYKVQVNWFGSISLTMLCSIAKGLIHDQGLIDKYDAFKQYVRSTRFGSRPSNKKDIQVGNSLLGSLITYAEGILSSEVALNAA